MNNIVICQEHAGIRKVPQAYLLLQSLLDLLVSDTCKNMENIPRVSEEERVA